MNDRHTHAFLGLGLHPATPMTVPMTMTKTAAGEDVVEEEAPVPVDIDASDYDPGADASLQRLNDSLGLPRDTPGPEVLTNAQLPMQGAGTPSVDAGVVQDFKNIDAPLMDAPATKDERLESLQAQIARLRQERDLAERQLQPQDFGDRVSNLYDYVKSQGGQAYDSAKQYISDLGDRGSRAWNAALDAWNNRNPGGVHTTPATSATHNFEQSGLPYRDDTRPAPLDYVTNLQHRPQPTTQQTLESYPVKKSAPQTNYVDSIMQSIGGTPQPTAYDTRGGGASGTWDAPTDIAGAIGRGASGVADFVGDTTNRVKKYFTTPNVQPSKPTAKNPQFLGQGLGGGYAMQREGTPLMLGLHGGVESKSPNT